MFTDQTFWLLLLSNVCWIASYFLMRRRRDEWRDSWYEENFLHHKTRKERNDARSELAKLKYFNDVPKE